MRGNERAVPADVPSLLLLYNETGFHALMENAVLLESLKPFHGM